ncbi:platelet receptor hypothetical protein [Limosa lapponica baueri]|uniref:Ig-like domain-containing protein n=1 Tax=Limosa lapponica baueri TaxID=1758121 RepID=A0A2I0TPN7_LIMLA|nr:platelet receptor hypothetical protein [Limosa lapponica baueri]
MWVENKDSRRYFGKVLEVRLPPIEPWLPFRWLPGDPRCEWGTSRWGSLHAFSPAGGPAAFLITTPYSLCICPEGQNVTLTCRISGPLADHHDLLYKTWYFSSNGDQSCSEKKHIRNVTEKELHHDLGRHHELLGNGTHKYPLRGQASHHGVEFVPDHHGAFHIVVMNLTLQDSGNYCCYAVEARWEHGKPHTLQVAHGFVELQIQQGEEGAPYQSRTHAGCTGARQQIRAGERCWGAASGLGRQGVLMLKVQAVL